MRRWRFAFLLGVAVLPLFRPGSDARGQEGGILPSKRQSGFETMAADTQKMQRDDLANPAMLWVREGEALWNSAPEATSQACAGCHGAASQSMRGVAARYPAFDVATNGPIDLASRIQHCRATRQRASEWPRESRPLLAMTAYVGLQSRGLPIVAPEGSGIEKHRANGKALFRQRLGQLNLSCEACHDDNSGKKLGASPIPQAHPTGYPIYRLEWQGVGSLQRRLRNCMTGVRAEPFAYGAQELIELELFLMQRAAGMPLETPGVRP